MAGDATTSTRVVVYPSDLGGCGHYRCIWPGRALQAEGVDVDVVVPNEPQERQLRAQWRERHDGVTEIIDVIPPDADVVVMQRPIDRHRVEAIGHLQRHGRRVVVEIDDDFDAIHPRNIAWPKLQPHISADRNRNWLHRACELADMVVVSTPALAARYGRHGRVRVVRNRIPARYLTVEGEQRTDGQLYVGWSGSIETHPDDLQVMGGGLAQALRSTGAQLAIVGTGRGVRKITGIDHQPLACGWRPLPEYPEALAQFDVGIVPLNDTPFNRAKSWLKGLEMAAVGVPFVASPLPEYVELGAAHELLTSPAEWKRGIRRLLLDEQLRADVAGRGRELAARHTVQEHAHEWWEAWTASLDRQEVRS